MKTPDMGFWPASLPVARDVGLAYGLSLVVAALMAGASAADFAFGSALYGIDPATVVGLLIFVVICFVPLAFLLRAATPGQGASSGSGRQAAGERQAKAG